MLEYTKLLAILAATLLIGCPAAPYGVEIPADMPEPVRSLVLKTFSARPATRVKAIKKLGELGEEAGPAVPFLIRLLDDTAKPSESSSSDVGLEAETAIRDIGKPATELCIAALKQASGLKRIRLIGALRYSEDLRTVNVLASLLSDPDDRIRYFAACSLSSSRCLNKTKSAIPALLHALKDNNAKVRSEAATALGLIHDPQVVEPLIELLKDNEHDVRRSAIVSLGETSDRRAYPFLMEIINNPKDEERISAIRTIGMIGEPAAIDVLWRIINDPHESDTGRYNAAFSLGYSRDKQVSQQLQDYFKRPSINPYVCDGAISSIAKIDGLDAIPFLMDRIKNKKEVWRIRFRSAVCVVNLAAGAIDDPDILDALKQWSGSEKLIGEGTDHLEDFIQSVERIRANGKTPEIRAAAKKILEGK